VALWPQKPDEEFKAFVYEQFSRIGKALASPQRLVILNILCQGEHTVESLSSQAGLEVANLSRHLQVLRRARLVRLRREGKHSWYSAMDEETCRFLHLFREFASRRLIEVQAALEGIARSPSRLHPVGREELLRRLKEKDTVLVDVRPPEEFQQAHLPGALSIPLAELERRIGELSREKQIIAYCRGRFCILADQAVRLLQDRGHPARRADDGVIEWGIDGNPLERQG